MIQKIDLSQKYGNSHISILYPGHSLGIGDSGIGSIGRIDQADIQGGTTIKMHPHSNDEILSYFRLGKAIHTDSAGITETISRKKLMLMKAGKVFYHEEKIIDRLEGLQIFIRPMTADYEPEVLFRELENEDSMNAWRLLASNQGNEMMNFTSETEIFDITINNQQTFSLPESQIKDAVFVLYAFQGSCKVNNILQLSKKECIVSDERGLIFSTDKGAEIVLFVTNKNQDCFKQGMFSGNKV
jgi:redox-sensitive bicupin YhaK (pirin superfamily)